MNEPFEKTMRLSYTQRYCIMAPGGAIVSFEDGDYVLTTDFDRVVKNGLFTSRESAEKSLGAIHGAGQAMFVVEMNNQVHVTFREVDPYTKGDIIAKARKLGLSDDDLRILMGNEKQP